MEHTQRVKIKADVMWAYMDKPNDMSGKYQVDLCNLSDAAVKALEDLGVGVRQKEEKGYFITCKSNNPIRAYDKDGDDIEGISMVMAQSLLHSSGFMSGLGRTRLEYHLHLRSW